MFAQKTQRVYKTAFKFRNCIRFYNKQKLPPKCWSCSAFIPTSQKPMNAFCDTCHVIQPPDENANYFEIFNLPLKFDINLIQLEKQYKTLQKYFHPDRFASKSEVIILL